MGTRRRLRMPQTDQQLRKAQHRPAAHRQAAPEQPVIEILQAYAGGVVDEVDVTEQVAQVEHAQIP